MTFGDESVTQLSHFLVDLDGEDVAIRLKDVLVVEFMKDILDKGIEKSSEDGEALNDLSPNFLL